MFESLERIEKSLFNVRNLTLKNTVSLGLSGKDNRRLDGVYKRPYKSTKYSNASDLVALSVKTSEFLVFSYSGQGEGEFEEVYVSYPHIEKVIRGFQQMRDALQEEALFIERDNELFLNADYEHFAVKISGLASGKSIVLTPDVITDSTTGDMAGVRMFIGSENYIVEANHEVFSSLVYFLENFNLQLSSQLLVNLAAMQVILSEGGGGGSQRQAPTVKPPKPSQQRKVMRPDGGAAQQAPAEGEEIDYPFENVPEESAAPPAPPKAAPKPQGKPGGSPAKKPSGPPPSRPKPSSPPLKAATPESVFDDEEEGSGEGGVIGAGALLQEMSGMGGLFEE